MVSVKCWHPHHRKIEALRTLIRTITLLTICLPLFTLSANANEARTALSSFIASAERYSGNFEQQLTDERGAKLELTAGEFWLQRPGMFRWHYAAPMERVLVSNRTKIWLYDVELDQVTVRDAAGEIENTPAGILVGDDSTLDNYELSVHERRGSYLAISLQPKLNKGDFTDILIGLDNNQLIDLRLADRFGQTTTIRFTDVLRNPSIEQDVFSLSVPEGVDVIDQTSDN
jgi:outer membrane lipoprotein carrier protein